MENLSSWIWIIVAVLWFGAKILPRLLRGKDSQTKVPAPQMPEPDKPARAKPPADANSGPSADFDTLLSSLGRSRSALRQGDQAPPPIEPK
jgi:hypothetical protein